MCSLVTGEREDLAKTRERFNEVFKKYTELEKKKKKVKKKHDESQETIVVRVLIRAILSSVVISGLGIKLTLINMLLSSSVSSSRT